MSSHDPDRDEAEDAAPGEEPGHEHGEGCDHDHDHDHRHDHGPPPDEAAYEGLSGWDVRAPSQSRRELLASVPWARYLETRQRAARKLARQVTVKGFRKGKVPPARVLALYGDEVRREATDELIRSVWEEVRVAKKFRVVGSPEVSELLFEEGAPVRFTAQFEVLPELEIQGLDRIKVDDKTVKVSAEDVEEEIQKLREARSQVVDSDKEETAPGDLALVTLHRFAPGADPSSAVPDATDEDVLIEVGSERNPPELDKAMLGLGIGEMRTFSEPSGEEGERTTGRVLLKAVKQRKLPELDDAFVKALGLGHESVEDLRSDVAKRLVAARTERARAEQDAQVVSQLASFNAVEMPKALVDAEAEARLRGGMKRLAMQGVDLEAAKIDWAGEFERARQGAESALRAEYLLELAADAEGVEVSDEDLARVLDEDAAARGASARQLRAEIVKSNKMNEFRQTVRRRLTLDKLRSGATVSVESTSPGRGDVLPGAKGRE